MKIWLIVALLAVATSVAVAATAVAEANLAKNATKVIEAETELPEASTDVAGDDEGSETTESSQKSKIVEEENEPKKGKHDKEKHDKSEPKEGENEEEEAENEEEENEDSEEGDSDEDSEEEESEGKKKKEASKVESEEEGDNKEEAVKFPTQHPDEIPTRSSTNASPVAADTHKSSHHVHHPEIRKPQPKWLFDTPIQKSPEVSAKVENNNPKSDFTKSSTSAAVQISLPSWPVAKSVETRPTHHTADVSSSDTRKPHHPKWFFNTAKEKSSDRSTKIESPKPTAIFEIPTRKVAATQIPTWPSITTVKPAAPVASNKPVDFSHSDNRKSNSQWFFSTASKPSDGFAKKESNNNARPAAIEIPTRNKPAAYQTTPSWTQSSRPVAPIYKPVEVSSPSPPRKTYPRWFFNIRD